ncbi:hypothetical protein LCGC14_2888020, partial [marine sediment metagenome]
NDLCKCQKISKSLFIQAQVECGEDKIMKLFGKTLDWFLDKEIAFTNTVSEGNSVMALSFSKIKQTIIYTMIVSGVSVGAEQGLGMEIFSQLPSWLEWLRHIAYFIIEKMIFILPALPTIEVIKDFFLGRWSRKVKYWHKKAAYLRAKGIDVLGKEQIDRTREMHIKICPDSKIPEEGYGHEYIKENKYTEEQ